MGRRVEIGRLAGDPVEEAGDVRPLLQRIQRGIEAREVTVRHGGVDRAVADGMEGHGLAPAL